MNCENVTIRYLAVRFVLGTFLFSKQINIIRFVSVRKKCNKVLVAVVKIVYCNVRFATFTEFDASLFGRTALSSIKQKRGGARCFAGV